jgi:hypothetical protein
MGFAFKLLRSLLVIIPICLFSPYSLLSKDLVAVLPFENQRPHQTDNWMGFYLQARMESYLQGFNCGIQSSNTTRLWQFKSNGELPVSSQNTVLISGSYQIVLNYGIVEIRVQRVVPEGRQKVFYASFDIKELAHGLDTVYGSVAKWIDPLFQNREQFQYPEPDVEGIRQVFQFRQILYQPAVIPEIRVMLQLRDLVALKSVRAYMADLAEGMMIISKDLPKTEKKQLLAETEEILRTEASSERKNSRILSLLAEVFHLNARPASWVEKSAEEALKMDPENCLALLMLALSMEKDEEKTKAVLSRMHDANPWIWPGDTEGEIQFQKGLFQTELQALKESGW